MFRRIAVIVAAAFLAVGLAVSPAAADDEIGLSRDGINWSTSLETPLFDPDFRWVPGDVEERTFQVRNDGPSDGVVTVDLVAQDPDGLLDSVDFALEARLGTSEWAPVFGGDTVLRPTAMKIAEGAETTVSIRGSFGWPTTAWMEKQASFVVYITMSESPETGEVEGTHYDAESGPGKPIDINSSNVDPSDNPEGGLPDTGSAVSIGLLWLAAGLIGTGLALVAGRRREACE